MRFYKEKWLYGFMAGRSRKTMVLCILVALALVLVHHFQSTTADDSIEPPVLKLLGYWQDKNKILAILQNEDGTIKSLTVGMLLGTATIKSITPETLTLEYPNHQQILLTY